MTLVFLESGVLWGAFYKKTKLAVVFGLWDSFVRLREGCTVSAK